MKKRIVVTGMGLVSCFGNDVEGFYRALLDGNSGVSPIETFDCNGYSTTIAATVKEFDTSDYIEKKQARRIDKCITYGMVAGKKALHHAALSGANFSKLNRERCGVLVSSGMGGMGVFADGVETLLEKGSRRVTPFLVPYILPNMCGALLAIEVGFMGPNYSISTACATSNNAIIAAANHIRAGDADLMVCGGTEAAITPLGVAGFCACKALSQNNENPAQASRPFDKKRDGFVIGEGAGVIVLESLEHALERGAPILAEYLGGGISCDAYHMTEPRQDAAGVVACLNNALRNSGIESDRVNYINAHATSTPLGDVAEMQALRKVFPNSNKIVVNATKSMIGHSLGAAGALEAIVSIKAIETGFVHPTINLEEAEEICSAFQIPKEALKHQVDVAISNSFGFGGHNASIVLSPYRA